MLQITTAQNQRLVAEVTQNFVAKCVLFVDNNFADWCADKAADEKQSFVNLMVDFAHAHNVMGELNIQKLIFWKIEYDFAMPLADYQQYKLQRKEFDENYRVAQFFNYITGTESLIKITLDGNTEAIVDTLIDGQEIDEQGESHDG